MADNPEGQPPPENPAAAPTEPSPPPAPEAGGQEGLPAQAVDAAAAAPADAGPTAPRLSIAGESKEEGKPQEEATAVVVEGQELKDATSTSRKSIGGTKEADKSAIARRKSKFQKPEDVKSGPSVPPPPGGGPTDFTATLQSFFTYQSHSSENVVLKPIRRPKLIFENTYRLESGNPFSPTRTKYLIQATLAEFLEPVKYNSKTINDSCKMVAEKIRGRLLTYRFDRYKFIVLVTMSSMTRQGVHIGFRNLWDSSRDSYAFSEYKNNSIFAACSVYAIYYD